MRTGFWRGRRKKIIIHLERVSRWWWAPFYYVEEEHWHIYCNDLNYKNLFTIIWDNFRKQRRWKGREKNVCRKIIDDASQILLSSSPPLLYVCITKVLTAKIVNFNLHHSLFFAEVFDDANQFVSWLCQEFLLLVHD